MRRTPLYDAHVAAGARMVPFAGWEMPVQYTGTVDEAKHVRAAVGLFDLCHMGRLVVTGPEAVAAVDAVVSCNVAKLKVGRCKYGLVCHEDGGVIDDVLVYKGEDRVHVIINAGNRDRDFRHFLELCGSFDCEVANVSDEQTMLALQGPNSEAVLDAITDTDLTALGYYRFTSGRVLGHDCLISRTGYTGEDGFELFFAPAAAREMWDGLLDKGAGHGMRPIGLGARDILRTEAGMPLYGHEISDTINPLEAGLGFGVDLSGEFHGADALRAAKEKGLARRLVGLEIAKRVARPEYPVTLDGTVIGTVTSGTLAPTLGTNIAMALVDTGPDLESGALAVDIRGKSAEAKVVKLPFYKRPR